MQAAGGGCNRAISACPDQDHAGHVQRLAHPPQGQHFTRALQNFTSLIQQDTCKCQKSMQDASADAWAGPSHSTVLI